MVEGRSTVFAKINAGGVAQRFALEFEDETGPLWFPFGEYDVAATYVKTSVLREEEADFQAVPEKHWLTLKQMEAEGVGLGDPVLVCGFPMGLSGTLKKYAIVRSGVIARLDAEIVGEDGCFLLDCLIFPGNSGGPVFEAGPRSEAPRLIGIVSGYLPYEDVAVSKQTGKPRITFEENSGLAAVVPTDAIRGACEACAASAIEVDAGDLPVDGRGRGSSAKLVPGPVE